MEELNSSMEEAELSKTLKKLQILEAEKDDIVLGFIKEKEIIETIHQEQLQQLKVKHEDEIQAIRQEWLREREKLLRESDSRQADAENHHEKKSREIEKKLIKKSEGDVKETEEDYRKEKRKLREEYEAVISQKTSEIEELYRENCILRSKSDPDSFEDKNKESEVMINKLQSKISALEEDKLAQIMKLKNEFEAEKAELERKQVREKAEFVKKLTSKYDQHNTNNEIEKNKSYVAYKQEMQEKIEIVEKLWEERNAEDRKKMNTRLENEIAMQKRRFADELQAKMLERDMTIENLEREKDKLLNSVHVERFELAKFYNRELSILNRLDSPTKEDIEVALIDEVAKLRDEQQQVIRNLEKRHKRKMRDLKKSQKPLDEIEEQQKNELEELRYNYEREKEEFEAKLRNEQLNLLKSFEFEKNDIERYFKQLMDEQESEFQDEIQAVQSECEEVKDSLDTLEKENNELKKQFVQEREQNGELLDKLQECESQNARLKEEIERDKRNKREPIKEISAVDNDKEGLKQTVEKLSSLNIQLSDELEKERKRSEILLEKVHELEKEQECLMTRSEADELQSSESGLELSTSLTEKPDRSNRDSYTDTSSVEGKKSGEVKKEPSKEDLDMQMKLQDSVQEYLLEIKVLQNAMDEKEMEIKQLKDTFAKEKSDLNEQIQHLTASLKSAVDDEDSADEEGDLEELKSRYKNLTDFINQVIKDLANKQTSSETPETSHQSSTSEQKVKGFANEVNALDELLSDELDSVVKEKLGKKLEELKNNIKRSHELEKLEQQRKHEQEKNRYLKELSDERLKELDISGEVWNAVCEKLGLDKEESQDKLKEILQEKDDTSVGVTSQKMESETKSKSDDDENSIDKESEVGKSPDFEELKKLKDENESLQRTLKELETHYEKDKEELMEKLQTQHKEFVLSSEAEVIEKLLKEKSALEEASIIERFNLGRIYYLEMLDELEEILSQRKEDMDKEHEKEKLNIILKFNKDIADLHKLLADKDDNEVKLLQEKNALAKKILDVQRRMPGEEKENDENNNTNDIKDEAKKLETSLPLKKELADLQQQRQDEHEAGIQNLEKALDLINDLLKDKNKGDDALHRRASFASASSKSDEIVLTDSPTGQSPTSVHGSVLSDEEIRTKEDLRNALENLIDDCLSKAKEGAESDTSSGASSDFESEPSSPPPESEEGVSDSGAESIESECVSIKKADLEMAMNLERFSMGRIYYNEFKDSLNSALKKLAKLKDMNQDLEDKLTSGVKDLVNRTIFGKMIVQSVDIETQTLEVQDPTKKTLDKHSDSDDNDVSLEASSEISEKEDVGDFSEDKDDELENLEKERMPESVLKESGKEGSGRQNDELQDHIKTEEQANEENGIEDKENGEQDSMPETDIKEISNKDATTQTDDLQDHMKTAEEVNEEKEIQDRQNDELEDNFPQKEDDFPNNEEIKDQKQSSDLSPEVSPRENKDKDDEIIEMVCEPATSHMLGQEAPENEIARKDGYDNKEPKSAAEEEEAKSLDSKDKETEKADIDEEQQTKHGDERPKDEDKCTTENKENADQEPDSTLEDEKPEDAANVKQSDTTDDESKFPKDQERTSDEDIPASNREEPEMDDQPLDDYDIETLKRENDKLKDKFSILKALVGKWFVEEIPELRTADETKRKEGESIPEDIGDTELKELREEEKSLANEIKAIEKEMSQLKDLNDANNKEEEEKLNAQELLALKQLENADKALKKKEEKDLIELLKKEKEEVSKKLEELEMEIEENKGQISDGEKSLFELMSKKLELEERVSLKARELDKDQKKLAQLQNDAEKKKVEEAVHSLAAQKKVLEELQTSPLSTEAQEDHLPLNQQTSEVSDSDTRKDEAEPSNLPLKDAHISSQVQELVKAKNNEEKKNRKIAKDIEKAKRDRDRYNRMTKDREDRLRPFIKKRQKLRKNLDVRGGITDEREEDEDLSTNENKESADTPNETSDEKTLPGKVEDIEREMIKTRDELSTLSKKAKIPLAMESEVNALPSKLKELELEKDIIDQQLTEKQSTIENLGSEEATELFGLLEAKAELNVKLRDLKEDFPKGYEELPNDVQEAYELACLEQEIKSALAQLDQEIKDEEDNFKEAVNYQRQGKLDDPKSAIAPMLERKQNLAVTLEEISSDIPCGDEAELVNAEAEQSNSEDASKRIREIEDLLRQNEDRIKDEPLRAAAELGKLIESKQNKTDELLKTSEALKEKVKMAESKENALENIPDSILSAIALGRETDEDNQLSFETVERENDIKERCIELQSLKNEGEDTKEKEDELLNVIDKQTSKEVQPASDKEQNKAFEPLPASVFAESKAIKSELENIEEKMEAILNGESEKENVRPELNDLSSSFQKKAEIEKNIKDYKELDDLLKKERKLAEALDTAASEKELEEIEQVIERKEEEISKLKAKTNEVEEVLEQLNDAKNNNEQNDDKLTLEIQEAIKETEQFLLEAQAEKERYYENNSQEESNVKEAMSSLEDELEETREEMEFVENELESLRSISEDDNAVSPELLEMTKLLNTQKSLKDYLLEIDTKLDDCDDTAKPSLSNEEIQALKDEKRDAERKLKEIQEEKSKFEVELQDDDIQETYDSLCEEKSKLEQARYDVLHKIHGSDVFVQMADQLEEDKPSEEEQKYYTETLNQMLSDQKTLIKLAEENEKLKDVACRQREQLENLSNSISASLGENLAQAIKLDSNLDEKENLQLPSAILDRINDKEETVADILTEMENENKKLTTLNEDLSNELDHLREKVGETLSDAILQSNSQLLEDKLMAPIDEVISADKTVEEILEERKDALERLKDVIGENLTGTLLKPKMDVGGTDDRQELLKAPKIMSETDEDLQTVIAAYEFELDNLGQGNDILKTMLGNDLVHALLDIDQERKNKHIPEYDNALPKQDDGELVDSQSSEAKEMPYVQDDHADGETKLEGEEASNLQLSRKSKPEKISKNVDELSDKQESEPQDSEGRSLQKPVGSSESEETYSETPISSQQPLTKADVEKYGMTAPALMVKENKNLGEVIKDYENELDTLKFRLGPELYEEILSAGVLDRDEDGGDLAAEEREIVSQEPQKPSDDSGSYKEERKDREDVKEDIYPGEQKDVNEQTRNLPNELDVKGQKLPTDIHDINDGDKDIVEEHREDVDEKGKLDGSDTEEKPLSSKVTGSKGTQQKSQKSALAAPKKMIEEKQSLADVIQGYENDLETLETRLGPELFQDILDAGKQYRSQGESEAKPEEAQQDTEESEIESQEPQKPSDDSGSYKEARQDSDDIKEGIYPGEQKDLNAQTREQHNKLEGKGQKLPTDIHDINDGDKDTVEEHREYVDEKGKLDGSYTEEKPLSSKVKGSKGTQQKSQKPALAAPKKMIEENQSLADVIQGYENDLETLKTILGPELFQDVLDAGKLYGAPGGSLADPGEVQKDAEESEIESQESKKPPNDSGIYKEAGKDSDDIKEDIYPGEKKDLNAQTRKLPIELEGKGQKLSTDIHDINDGDKDTVEEHREDVDEKGKLDGSDTEEKPLSSKVTGSKGTQQKSQKPALAAPKKMIEEKQSLADVIQGYENDLETLETRLGPELFQDILDAGKQYGSQGESEAKPEEAQQDTEESEIESQEPQKPSDDSYSYKEARQDSDDIKEDIYPAEQKDLNAQTREQHNKLEGKGQKLPTDIHDIDDTVEKHREYVDEKGKLDGSYTEEKPLSSKVKGSKGTQQKSQKPALAAPKKMIEENQSLADVIQGYENDLETLKTILGPELFQDVLDAGKLYGAPGGSLADPGEVQKDAEESEIESQESKKPSDYSGIYKEAGKDSDDIKEDIYPGEKKDLNEQTRKLPNELEVKGQKLPKDIGEKPLSCKMTGSKGTQQKSQKPALAAPKKMIEEKQSLADVIQGYENDLETLETRLGPELFQDILDAGKQYGSQGESEAKPEEAQQDAEESEIESQEPQKPSDDSGSYKEARQDSDDIKEGIYPGEQKDLNAQTREQHNKLESKGQKLPTNIHDINDTVEEHREYVDEKGKLDGSDTEEKPLSSKVTGSKGTQQKSQKPALAAPKKMIEEKQSLADVIQGYENDLETLETRLGPELFQDILDAGKQYGSQGESEAKPEEAQQDAEESEIESQEPQKPSDDSGSYKEARQDSDDIKEGIYPGEQKDLNAQTREQHNKLESKGQKLPTNIHDINDTVEEHREYVDEKGKLDGSDTEEKPLSSKVTGSKGTQQKSQKPALAALAAPKKMIEEKQSLADVIQGYENDLETLETRLGPELFQDILDADKQYGAPGGSETKPEEAQQGAYSEGSGDGVAFQERQDSINATCESEDKGENLSSLETTKDDLQRKNEAHQPNDLGQAQFAAIRKGQNNEFEEPGQILAEDNSSLEVVVGKEASASVVEQKEGSKIKAKEPSLIAPRRMIEENQTLAEVVEGYENDLDILKSRLGPELYDKILDAGKLANTELESSKKEPGYFADYKQPVMSGKAKGKPGDTKHESQDKKDSESMPYTKSFDSQEKTSVDDTSIPAESGDRVIGSTVTDGKNDLEDEEMNEEERRELGAHANKPVPLTRVSEAQSDQFGISAPKHMIEENKTLEEVIKGYESDLETLKSKLGPQLSNSLLGSSNLDDEITKQESFDRIDQSKVPTEKQPSTSRIDDSKIEGDSMEELLGKDTDHEENMKGNDQEKELDHSLSEGETYLSDGELYESFNIPDIKKGGKSEPIVDDKLKFSAPSIMAKEGKTLGEVLEIYENDLEALKSKLGPKLFENVLEIAKDDDEQATAGIAKDGYDSKKDSRTKDLYTVKSSKPAHKKVAQGIDAERKYADELDQQAKGKYDEELNERENDRPETEEISQESGERLLTSIDNSDYELLSEESDLVALKQMLEENKTLEEIIQSYENDLRDFRESLGPQLCDAILNARKGTNYGSNAATLARRKEDVEEPEMDYLEQTTDEKGKKADNWKAEIGKVISESQPPQAKDNKEDILETSETSRHGDNQNEKQPQNEEGKDISDFDKDAKDDQVAEQNLTTQKLEAPIMIAEGKKLDEIICGYENELGALKSRIGPILYKDIVNAGKLQQNSERKDSKKPEDTEEVQASDVILKEKEDENVEERHEEFKGKDERPSADIAIQGKIEEDTEKQTLTKDLIVGEKDIEEQKTNQEQEKDGAATENNSSDLQLKAAQEILVQNKTLQEVVQGYEKDLATLNSKLGPELFQSVLETTTKDDAAKASNKDNAFDDELSETQAIQETGKEIRNAEASRVQPDSEIKEVIQGSVGEQLSIASKVTHKQGEELPLGKQDLDLKSQAGLSTGNAKDSLDGKENQPIVSEVTHEKGEEFPLGKEDLDVKSQAGLSTGSSKDSIYGTEKQPSQIKEPLKAPILLSEQGRTLQEIIEKYEKDLDTFNTRLGPNLAKAVVEARGKKSIGIDDENEQPIKKVEQDLNQDKIEGGTENVSSKEIVSSKDNATHEEPVAKDEYQSHEKDEIKKAEEIEEQQEIDYYIDMFENDLTLEDAVKKLKKESKDLKEKLGPNLSKILLEEENMAIEKEEHNRKEKEVGDSETKDMEMPCSASEEQMGSSSSEKVKEEILDAEENIADSAEIQEVKCEDGTKDGMTINDVCGSGSKQKTFMAPKLMEAHNAPLEEVIEDYEHDLSVLKTALGPNLVNLLLNDKGTPTADDSMLNLTDAGENKESLKPTQQDKEETRGLETETTRANEENSISQEQRQIDGKEKQEKTEKEAEQDEMQETEDECLSQGEPQESKELEKIISLLLNGDKEGSLEDILRTLHSDLDVLTSKLGSNLSKSLLTMDTDSYNVSKDKDLDDDGDKSGTESKLLELEAKDENIPKSKKVEFEDQEVGKDVKNLEAEDNKTDDILGPETAGEEMELDLAAVDQMEENSQTLEEVIKQYENNLERYESTLGPYLSKAILTKEFTPEAAEKSQAKSSVDDKNADEYVPLDLYDNKNEDEVKVSKLDGYLEMLNKGKTLEDLLIQYDPVHEVPPSTHAAEGGLPVTNETEPYSDQITRLQNKNHDLQQKLDNLNSKIGESLVNQLQSKKDEDVTKDKDLGVNLLQQREGEKDTPEDNVAGVVGQKLILEAPVMMEKDHRTLEDIVAEYENDLKEKTNAQEQLEQCIGPHLLKELCELRRQEEEEGEMEEKVETESAEKEKANKKPKSKYDVVNKMAEEEKSLAAVLGDYENDLEALERENASLRKALEGVSGDGADLGEIISKYENQITMLENANKEAENNFEEKHNELQNEIDDLRSTLEKLAQTLRQDFLDDLVKQESDNGIEALQIMEKENKTLAEVVEEYEENMKNLEREKAVLQQIAGQGEEGASMLDTVNDYEDAIKGLKEVNKVLNKRIDALTEKIGPQLTKQIMDLCDEGKPSETGGKDLKAKEETETMAAVKEMEDKKITLEEILKMYDDQNKKEIASVDSSELSKVSEKELDEKSAEMDDKEKKADENVNEKQVKNLEAVSEENQCKLDETPSAHKQDYTEKEEAAEVIPKALCDKIGMQLIGDIKELDNKTYEELEKEDKRPYALRTMKARDEKLEDVIKAYENTLTNYGLLDTSTFKEESLASELAAIEEGIAVEEVEKYGAQASDYVMPGNKNEEENADSQDNDDGKQIEMLKKELEEEKTLKEKYQKDAEDLLNDIVKLKMKNASGEDVDEEEIEKQIKEEYEQKQENKHLKEDLSKEKEKNKELQDENDELKAEIQNMEKEIKNLEKAIEKMQGSALGVSDGDVDGKIKELLVNNENLEKELEALKNQLKENEENHKNEKNNLLQQSENEKRDTIKDLLEAKAEVEVKLQEQLALCHELEEKLKQTPEQLDKSTSEDSEKSIDNVNTDETSEDDEDKLAQLKMRNESLKEQLDLSEESMKDALQKYQDTIKSLEIEKAKLEDDKKHEIELLNNKLELEKAALERLKNDYDEMLKKEKERQMEDFEKDLERERRRSQKDLVEQSEDFGRKQNLHKQELQDAKEKAEKGNAELRKSLEDEKEKLQKMFDEQMRQKDAEHEKILNQLREKLEDQMITEKAEMNVQFRHEKSELKTQIEKNIYGDELQKNIDLENDFQESLNKVLKDHANEIEEIEKEMAQAENRFKEQKLKLLEEFENEKLKEAKQYEKDKQEMESTIENLLKEIIKLKHQRKEMRQQYRVEKQSIEEIAENERIEIQENLERSKNELVTKLKQSHEKEMESEKEKYEAVIKELQEALERAEAKKKELEEKLRSESLKAEESLNNKSVNESTSTEITREVKVIKRGIEMEYEQKLTVEKQRFEDTLQGLRREVGNLQEKRKIIQERVYNQETHSTERHVLEKSIANYKLEVLSKLEGDMAQRIERERKPLEEEVRELQIENEELKRQRWEMKAQFRRDKASLEEEFEREKETLEKNLNKEKEELRKRLEAKLQKEKQNKVFDVKVSRSTSPVLGEPSPRIDNTVRMLKQENLSLVSQNAKHEIDIEQLNEKLKFMEMNFKEMMETEKLKAEKMKKIQEQIPKTKLADPKLPAPEYKSPSTGIQDDAILHTLQEKDQQIHQLLETKKYYESVFGELCDEAGLFELDRNQVV